MKKSILLAVILFGVFSLKAYATPQIPDILIYDGKKYPIQADFLDDYFKKFPERNPKPVGSSCSAAWRGYQSTYEVVGERIYLKDVVINPCASAPVSGLNKVVPGGKRLSVDWVSGLIQSGYGDNDENPYGLEFFDAYEKHSIFEVEDGRVLEVKHFDNKGYRAFKKKQFEAFRKTAEYETRVKKILADGQRSRLTRKDADQDIQFWIFSYLKRFQNSTAVMEKQVYGSDLQSHLKKWKKRSIADYDMVIECFCGNGIGGPAGSVLVKVRDGETRSIVSTRADDTRETRTYENLSTVEKMFGYIEQIRDKGAGAPNESNGSGRGFPKISTEYDHEYGYPRTIRILWAPVADGASVFTVKISNR